MNKITLKNRLKHIRKGLSRAGCNCLIVTKPANVTYVTGFTGDDSWAVILPRSIYLITDGRYTTQAKDQCRMCGIIERRDKMVKAVAELLRQNRIVKTAAIEKSTSIAYYEQLKKELSCRLKTAGGIIESVRRIKDVSEISAIRAAVKIALKALEKTRRQIHAGLSENQVAGILDFHIREFGCTNSFPTIVAFGPNAAMAHHQPTDKKLRRNDTVLIDFGVRYKNYCCDLTRCFAVGRPNSLYQKIYNAVFEAQKAAIKMIKSGIEIKHVDAAAREVLEKNHLPLYSHGTGHGLGLEVHEIPAVSNMAQGALMAGDIITIEPAVYIPSRLGVRIEDDILVTKKGFVVLK